MVDLVDQDHRVAHDHAGERDQAEQRDEAERPVETSSATGRADQPERRRQNTSARREKLCSWIISSASIDDAITGNTHDERGVGLGAFLDGAADLDAVAVGSAALIGRSFGSTALVTSGACTPSTTSPRTVSTMSRLRRHRIGSSNS